MFVLIDDDKDDRMFFSMAIEATGKNISCVAGEDGVRIIDDLRQSKSISSTVLFLDINIPQKSGWFFLNLIKLDQQLKNLPVIMYSTSSNEIDALKAKRCGALFLFTKPESIEGLQGCLEVISLHLEAGTLNGMHNTSCKWFHHAA